VIADITLRLDIADLYADYGACLDEGRLEAWPDFFTEDARYRVIPRENYDAGRPLATIAQDGRGMLKDRVFAAASTLFHAPYYQRHIVGGARILSMADDGIEVQANYLVLRTKRDCLSEVFNAGRYLDRVVRDEGRLRFSEKLCVFDSELIPNSLIYPI
jgi:salicylate 5-hydroxylase small subunit